MQSRVRKGGERRRRIDLRKTLFILPNMITMAAVFCGFNAIRICAKPGAEIEDFHRAAVLLMFAMLLDPPDGRAIYRERLAIVEPVFVTIRAPNRLDRFTLRGRQKVNTQWKLYCLVHNLEKIRHAVGGLN